MKLSAAFMIESCGLKGAIKGDAQISERHSLVFINRGSATGAEIWALASRARNAVKEKFGVDLETEVRIYRQP